jgi:putative nucleotidyltransferase with HDIG domain
MDSLVCLADAKETSGGGHSRRVSQYALMGAMELGMSRVERQNIEYAAILHDIGKLSVPDYILNKSQPLTDEEWTIIRKHPVTGFSLLKNIPFLKESSKLILHHHERFDGMGYPERLSGDDIPLGARLLAVADAFDHMTSNHPYKKAISRQEAFSKLHRGAASQFCPACIKAFNSGFVRSQLSRKTR